MSTLQYFTAYRTGIINSAMDAVSREAVVADLFVQNSVETQLAGCSKFWTGAQLLVQNKLCTKALSCAKFNIVGSSRAEGM